MRVTVLGAGLAGITSAWYLLQAGHQVTVIDRQPGAGLEASYANGGQISVSHPEPWANPQAPLQILRWLGREDAPLLFRPHARWQQWAWGMRFLRECLPGRSLRNGDAIAALAMYSRAKLRELRAGLPFDYDCLTRGILHLFFSPAEYAAAEGKAAWLRRLGMQVEMRDARGCREIEPALAAGAPDLQGGIYAPDDESGDAHKFVQALAEHAAKLGVRFHYGWSVDSLEVTGESVARVGITDSAGIRGAILGDAFLVALGSYTPLLVRRIGERLPIYPVKGYSVTLPLAPNAAAPLASVTDESRRIVCSRLGERLRIAGTAELDGYNTAINQTRCQAILRRALELFPGAGENAGTPQFWAGLRPATPNNLPIIGRSRYANLYYNTGHGTLGWTLACGSGQAIADIISGRAPEVRFPFHPSPVASAFGRRHHQTA